MKANTKPVSAATRALMDEMRVDAAPATDKLERARDMVRQLRDQEAEIAGLEERLKTAKETARQMKEKTLPDFFDEVGVSSLMLEAEGNMPKFEIAIADYYHANIPEEEAPAAFSYLKSRGEEDLIKTTFTIAFGLNEAKQTERFARSLEKAGIEYSVKQGVPWNTLTAWFKVEHKRKPLPAKAMALLGATVGRVAKIVKQKETK
jgi:hypothetical protein